MIFIKANGFWSQKITFLYFQEHAFDMIGISLVEKQIFSVFHNTDQVVFNEINLVAGMFERNHLSKKASEAYMSYASTASWWG